MAHRPRSECPYLVTADNTLLGMIPHTRARSVLNRVLLPQQAAYLTDLMTGDATTIGGFTRALWSTPKDLTSRIRDYYTDRILEQYESALLADMPGLVESVMEAIEKDTAVAKEAGDWKDSEKERIKLFNMLDRFEPKFYESMLAAKKKAGLA